MRAAPLPARTLLAICERHGYRRTEAAELSRDYVVQVLQHERDGQGGLALPAPPAEGAPRSHADAIRGRLARWKVPAWMIERELEAELDRQAGASGRRANRGGRH